jgi:hypothetical protein
MKMCVRSRLVDRSECGSSWIEADHFFQEYNSEGFRVLLEVFRV